MEDFKTTFHGISRFGPHVGEMWFGNHMLQNIGQALEKVHAGHILFVLDAKLQKLGAAAPVFQAVEQQHLSLTVFNQITPSPTDQQVDQIREQIRNIPIDTIVALGGGSAIDAAKAVAALQNETACTHDYLVSGGNRPLTAPASSSLILIPTTAGSGAELTILSAIFNTKDGLKDNLMVHLFADIILLDPSLIQTCPQFFLYVSAIDALSHSMERLTNKNSNPHGDMIAGQCVEWIWNSLPVALSNPSNLNALGQLQLASHYCMDFTIEYMSARANLNHALAGSVGYRYHLDHGHAVALTLPAYMKFLARHHEADDACRMIAEKMKLPTRSGSCALQIALAVEQMNHSMHLPTLRERGVSRNDLDKVLPHLFGPWKVRVDNCVVAPTPTQAQEILDDVYSA